MAPTQDDKYQKIEYLHIESSAKFPWGRDLSYDNPEIEFHPTPAQLETGFDAKLQFTATREEHAVALHGKIRER